MNTPSGHNPYKPPEADVTPPVGEFEKGELINGGQWVPAGNAISWIGGGWTLFTRSPGIWIIVTIILFVISLVLGFIPLLGTIASCLLMPIFIGGVLLGCRALDNGDSLRVDHLFAGFGGKGGQLALVGLLLLVATIIMVIVLVVAALVMFGAGAFQNLNDKQAMVSYFTEHGLSMILLLGLLLLVMSIALGMMYLFAPALVALQDLDAISAMKQSLKGCSRNFLGLAVFGILLLVLAIIAAIPFGLGFLVWVPLMYGAQYTAYKDIFLKQ